MTNFVALIILIKLREHFEGNQTFLSLPLMPSWWATIKTGGYSIIMLVFLLYCIFIVKEILRYWPCKFAILVAIGLLHN